MAKVKIYPGALSGIVNVPSSKSMGHREIICAALAQGISVIDNISMSDDIKATLRCLKALGVQSELTASRFKGRSAVKIYGEGTVKATGDECDCGESGSTLRFLLPLGALCGAPVTFTGAGRLGERPLRPYYDIFDMQGVKYAPAQGLPVTVEGRLHSGKFTLPGNVSSQFISGLLFALPLLPGDSTLHLIPPVESRSYIDMTRAVQAAFGVHSRWLDETTLLLPGGQQYHPCDYNVEGDYSQAAFPAVLGAVCGGVTITGLAPDTLQGDAAILDILRRCGAVFTRKGDSVTFAKAPLHGVDIDLADCPDLGPVLMVLGLLCKGTTVIRNAERLRLKESDRIAAMEAELRACGGVLESDGGTITVHGCAERLHAPAAPLHGHNDHRVVMSLAVLAAAGLPLTVDDAEAIQKSWPGFFADAAPLGVEVEDA